MPYPLNGHCTGPCRIPAYEVKNLSSSDRQTACRLEIETKYSYTQTP